LIIFLGIHPGRDCRQKNGGKQGISCSRKLCVGKKDTKVGKEDTNTEAWVRIIDRGFGIRHDKGRGAAEKGGLGEKRISSNVGKWGCCRVMYYRVDRQENAGLSEDWMCGRLSKLRGNERFPANSKTCSK